MEEKRYNITFGGKVAPGHDIEEAKRNLTSIFKLGDGRVERLFIGKQVLVKKDIAYKSAMKYRIAFEKAGAICGLKNVR